MPDEEQVVWPEDPIEADTRAAEAEPEPTVQPHAVTRSWPGSFEEALKQSQASSNDVAAAEAPAPAAARPEAASDDHPTQPTMPAISAKTVPPVGKTAPSLAALGEADEAPTSTFRAQPPMSPPAAEEP